jgi:hypothetical protein
MKFGKIIFKSALIAGATKAGVMLLKKFNKDGTLEQKANDAIDSQAEKAKSLAKLGVRKAISVAEDKTEDE